MYFDIRVNACQDPNTVLAVFEDGNFERRQIEFKTTSLYKVAESVAKAVGDDWDLIEEVALYVDPRNPVLHSKRREVS